MERSSGKLKTPARVLIAGVEGIGKTTLASQAPGAVIIDIENGSNHLDCERYTGIRTWQDALAAVTELIKDKTCQTIVIDTIDRLARILSSQLCAENKWKSIEDLGFGKGYTILSERWRELMKLLQIAYQSGKNTIMISHSQLRSVTQPEIMGSYDRYELRIDKRIGAIVKEWVDAYLFCNYQLSTIKDGNNKNKVQKSERVICTTYNSVWEAKNRYGLADILPLEFKSIEQIFMTTKEEK